MSEVAIITEQESEKSRKLTNRFSKCFETKAEDCSEEAAESGKIKTFRYFKGLDAFQQIIDKQDQNEDYQAAKKWNERLSLSINDLRNPPVGPGQLDYLHRLAEEIKKPHNEIDLIHRVNAEGIKAVGIFGSDIYDKLLILEALRAEMPNLLVFTTDLDALMFHPQHWRWARNLIVASPFDLRLNEQYQKNFPAFRDSRQTNIYYTTRGAVSDDIKIEETNIPPLVFEIGRNGPIRLPKGEGICYDNKSNEIKESCKNSAKNKETRPTDETSPTYEAIHPVDHSLKQVRLQLGLLFGITLALVCLLWGIRPHSGSLFLWLFWSVVIIFIVIWPFAIDQFGEPFSFTDGVSLWPAMIIQMIAISLAMAFCFNTIRILEGNFHGLNRQYFDNRRDLKTLCTDQKPRSLGDLCTFGLNASFKEKNEDAHQAAGTQPITAPKYEKTEEFVINFFIPLFFFASVVAYVSNDRRPEDLNLILCFWLLIFFTIAYVYLERNCKENMKSIKYWIDKDNCYPIENQESETKKKNASQDGNTCRKFILLEENNDKRDGLWKEYHEHGRPRQRFIRVIGMWLFFAIIETVLFYLLPPWPSPCRGDPDAIFLDSCSLDYGIRILSFIVIMILIFLVLDAVRLSYFWIQKLRTKHPLLLHESNLDVKDIEKQDYQIFYKARKDNPLETLEKIVTLVAERTLVVDRLIYYPMLVLMLMLFAGITYFDNQHFPLSKGITFAASFSLLLFAGFIIRVEAEKLRAAALKSAESLVGNNNLDSNATIRKIRDINSGIFQPMLEQPVMRALLIILASIGLFASEYLMLFG